MRAEALIVGTRVPEHLRARVCGVYARACYLRTDGRVAAVLFAEGVGPAPHGIVVAGPRDGFFGMVEEGAVARIESGTLTLERGGRQTAWSLRRAERYDGDVRVDGVVAGGDRGAIDAVAETLTEHESLRHEEGTLAATARSRVRAGSAELTLAVRSGDARRAADAVERLVGLGPGLTPSGDDALVGFLAARWSMTGEGGIAAAAVERACSATNDISRSFLELAAVGGFAEPLASLARAVAVNDSAEARCRVRECLRLGATSGADGVAGLLGGYASLSEGRPAMVQGA